MAKLTDEEREMAQKCGHMFGNQWHHRLALSMVLSAAVVFIPLVLLLIISAVASSACWVFGGHWCAP